MPLYEYQCKKCGGEFEKMVRFSEADQNPTCPYCQSQEARKKISTIAVSGFSFSAGNSPVSSSCAPRGGFS